LEAAPIVYLETWLHTIVRSQLAATSPVTFSEKSSLADITRTEIERYQCFNLQQTLQYVYRNSYFYHEYFQKVGIQPEDILNLEDLSRLPFTEPGQIAEEPYRFLCLSRAEIARVTTFITSGTTGPQKKIFWTQSDLERIIRFMAAGIGTVADTTDVVQICLPAGRPYSQADLLARGVEKIGAGSIIAGVELSSQEQLSLLETHHSTILFGYTPHIIRLSRELQTHCDLGRMGIKALFLASEYLPESMRKELQDIWNCRIHTHYGLTEMGLGVAVECSAGNGYHFNEADLLLEIVNPQTGAPVLPGQNGELVFTTLNREAMPLIRYRTGDISRLITGPCSCGAASLLKFGAVRKRCGAIVTLGNGEEIYPAAFDDLLFEIPGLIDYQVVLLRKNGKDRLDFKIELLSKSEDRIPEIIVRLFTAPVISNNLKNRTMTEPQIELVESGSLKTVSRAKKMIVDQR
jgi:phenylacetate-CoA ligase